MARADLPPPLPAPRHAVAHAEARPFAQPPAKTERLGCSRLRMLETAAALEGTAILGPAMHRPLKASAQAACVRQRGRLVASLALVATSLAGCGGEARPFGPLPPEDYEPLEDAAADGGADAEEGADAAASAN